VNADPMTWNTPFSAGSICSTVSDLITWQRALNQGRVVRPAGLSLMRAPTVLSDGTTVDYGLGTRREICKSTSYSDTPVPAAASTTRLSIIPTTISPPPSSPILSLPSAASSLPAASRAPCLRSRPAPEAEQSLSEADIASFSGRFESAEGSAILFDDQGRIYVKFAEDGPLLPLVYLGDGAFATGPSTISKFYMK